MFGFVIVEEPHSGSWAFASTAWRVDPKFGKGKPIIAWCYDNWEKRVRPLR